MHVIHPYFSLLQQFDDLYDTLQRKGFFKPSVYHEAVNWAYVLVPQIMGIYLMHHTSFTYWGTFLFSFGTQQAGWVGHDYSHHGVFNSPYVNDMFGRFAGWLQGYELQWWKARHNTHHMVTNEVGHDPDIKTSPLFTYCVEQWPELNHIQRYQHLYFVPALALLHFYWMYESLLYCATRLPRYSPHLLLLLAYYPVIYWVFEPVGILPFLVFGFLKGFMTGVCVFSTHYAEERTDASQFVHQMSFGEQSARGSRNIKGGWWVDRFSGNISRQVQHHMVRSREASRNHLCLYVCCLCF